MATTIIKATVRPGYPSSVLQIDGSVTPTHLSSWLRVAQMSGGNLKPPVQVVIVDTHRGITLAENLAAWSDEASEWAHLTLEVAAQAWPAE